MTGTPTEACGERELALRALRAYRRRGTFASDALDGVLRAARADARSSALVTAITRGVLRNMALCDFYIERMSSRPIGKIEPQVLDILRLSAYQMAFMGKIPVSAAVNEGVALARRHANSSAAGFVNAVLRALARSLGALPEPSGATKFETLAIKYSHPPWLVGELDAALGGEGIRELLEANNAQPPLTVRVNTLRTDVRGAIGALGRQGIEARPHSALGESLVLESAGNPAGICAMREGYIFVQDAASAAAAIAGRPKPGDTVLDGCAAPGGKSFAASILMMNKGAVISRDISAEKLAAVADGARRLGITVINTRRADARVPADVGEGALADVVYADVPCSGFGAIRRKPEIRYKQPQDLRRLPEMQLGILSGLSTYVKPGGALMYSTCTVLRRENEDVAEEFLRRHGDFRADPFSLPGGLGEAPDGMVTLWPHIHGTDGFFICRMVRGRASR
ncbi:MAG: 16S rRNA (cytosine(967)-C(5))-methyltransferase RsmB [Oscillospiraceae bacterium]|nr:16S rRNA (cytosine(967)-C(5))-methyltransferase RsmB [Oscillospiraceae bacterium]